MLQTSCNLSSDLTALLEAVSVLSSGASGQETASAGLAELLSIANTPGRITKPEGVAIRASWFANTGMAKGLVVHFT